MVKSAQTKPQSFEYDKEWRKDMRRKKLFQQKIKKNVFRDIFLMSATTRASTTAAILFIHTRAASATVFGSFCFRLFFAFYHVDHPPKKRMENRIINLTLSKVKKVRQVT